MHIALHADVLLGVYSHVLSCMCVLPSTLNWEILGAEICLLCLLDPKFSQIRIGTQLLVFINQYQWGYQLIVGSRTYSSTTSLELSALTLKETGVVVGTWGTE